MKTLKQANEHNVVGLLFIGILAVTTFILISLNHYGVGSNSANDNKKDTHSHTIVITQTPPANNGGLPAKGVIGTWTQEHEGKDVRVTGYTPCDGIAHEVSDRLKSLKFVCDTTDGVIHFDGDDNTYRNFLEYTPDNQIIWDEAKELPVVHTVTGSGGILAPDAP